MALTKVSRGLLSTSIEDNGNATAITIDSSESVGIGTSSPSSRLDVAGSSNSTYLKVGGDDASNGRALTFTSSASASFNGAVHTIKAPSSQGVIALATGSSERARIDASGNLLVGTTNATHYGTSTTTGSTLFGNGTSAHTTNGSATAIFNRISSDGEILQFRKNGTTVGSISTNANSLPSDRNFKRNIQDLTLGLDFVESLNPVTYNFKIDDEGQAVMTGLIAQEVEESLTAAGVEKNSMTLLQHAPTEDVNESDYQMDYLKFVPILINSIKEQQTLIESLTARIAALEE